MLAIFSNNIINAHLVLETGAQVGNLGHRVVETLEKVPRNRETRANHYMHTYSTHNNILLLEVNNGVEGIKYASVMEYWSIHLQVNSSSITSPHSLVYAYVDMYICTRMASKLIKYKRLVLELHPRPYYTTYVHTHVHEE